MRLLSSTLSLSEAAMRRLRVRLFFTTLALLAAMSFTSAIAVAALCGDSVDGRDVPCGCGDVVVSDVVLGAEDPVVNEVCTADGLIVRAGSAKHPLTVDLHGHTLRGRGRGAAVWVVYGGPGGAAVISTGGPATLDGFRDGVAAHGPDTLAKLEDVLVLRPERDGVRVMGQEYAVQGVEVWGAGRDGFGLRGDSWQTSETRAMESGRYGYLVLGQRGALTAPTTAGSGRAGIHVLGTGHRLSQCVATGSAAHGVHINATQVAVDDCVSHSNAGDGIKGVGAGLQLSGNVADGNGNNGIAVHGARMVDGGGNRGADNRGEKKALGTAQQCTIGGTSCAQ